MEFDKSRAEWNALYYEVLHNLVLETTRLGIEVQNMRMRIESLSSRLDFSERRVRALEGVVQYRPEAVASQRSARRARQTVRPFGPDERRLRARQRRRRAPPAMPPAAGDDGGAGAAGAAAEPRAGPGGAQALVQQSAQERARQRSGRADG